MLWDQHACVELVETADLAELDRYRPAGGGLVSLNVGYAPHGPDVTASLLRAFRSQVRAIDGLALAASVDDVDQIAAAGDTAVVFDLEDCAPLGGDLDAVSTLVAQGVRRSLRRTTTPTARVPDASTPPTQVSPRGAARSSAR